MHLQLNLPPTRKIEEELEAQSLKKGIEFKRRERESKLGSCHHIKFLLLGQSPLEHQRIGKYVRDSV